MKINDPSQQPTENILKECYRMMKEKKKTMDMKK